MEIPFRILLAIRKKTHQLGSQKKAPGLNAYLNKQGEI